MRKPLLALPFMVLSAPAFAANDYPTDARVQYVFECMADHGGENYGNMYKCSCMIDRIAGAIPYDQYVEADTFTRARGTIGERGGVFRDPPRAKELRSRLEKAEEQAEQRCFAGEASVSR